MQPASAEWMEGQLAQVTLSQRRSLVWKAFPLTPDPEAANSSRHQAMILENFYTSTGM